MVSFKSIAISAALLLCVSHASAMEDIKRILRRAGVQWANQYGTSITSGALDSGFCFSRNDPSDNEDPCQHQPAEFEFLEAQNSVTASNLESSEPTPGSMVKSLIRCDVPKNGVPMTCGVGSNNAKASATAVANANAFSFTQGVTVGALFGVPPLVGTFSTQSSFQWATTQTKTETETVTNTALASVSITVLPGNCTELEIRSTPTVKTGTITYTVPLSGGVSIWLKDPISFPGTATHYNWLLSVGELIEIAVKGGYAEGLKNWPPRFVGHANIYETTYHSEVGQQNCGPVEASSRLVEGIFEPASAQEMTQEVPSLLYPPPSSQSSQPPLADMPPPVADLLPPPAVDDAPPSQESSPPAPTSFEPPQAHPPPAMASPTSPPAPQLVDMETSNTLEGPEDGMGSSLKEETIPEPATPPSISRRFG